MCRDAFTIVCQGVVGHSCVVRQASDMGSGGTDGDADSATEKRHEIARMVADSPSEFLSLMADSYRGEVDRATTWRSRLDRTAVTGQSLLLARWYTGVRTTKGMEKA